jgi:exodeoxyribonuclease III
MDIATWNVNSIGVRLPHVLEFLKSRAPDVLLLQELKCEETKFPRLEIEALGYRAAVSGQKTYNGVAILSKHAIEDVKTGLPGDEADTQSRYIEATIQGLRVASVYLPNGNPVDSEKFPYKLRWFDRLYDHARALLALEAPAVLGGDFNVIPEDDDCHDPAAWAGDALFRMDSRRKWRALLNLGYADAFRLFHKDPGHYTFWDYQAGSWPKNNGIRIDHFLLSPHAADRAQACAIDKEPRGWEKASDHTPVILTLE